MPTTTTSLALVLALATAGAQAAETGHPGHGDHGAADHQGHHAGNQQTDWGRPGSAKAVTRTIDITMTDAMRFTPDRLEIRQGETVRLRVRNAGKLDHELVLGTPPALAAHAAQMQQQAPMVHDEDEAGVEVKPGRRGELVWNFNRPGAFQYACLLPGHYQAGMVGTLTVVPAAKDARR
jgi:uncharacterized cupredoxin-like copper-binding protein